MVWAGGNNDLRMTDGKSFEKLSKLLVLIRRIGLTLRFIKGLTLGTSSLAMLRPLVISNEQERSYYNVRNHNSVVIIQFLQHNHI